MAKSKNKKSSAAVISIYMVNILIIILCVLAFASDIIYVYYKYFSGIYTSGTNYIGDQLAIDDKIESSGDLTEDQRAAYEKRSFIEVNLMSNDKNNGIRLNEIKFNIFKDYTLTKNTYISAGIQRVGDLKSKDDIELYFTDVDDIVVDGYYYYTSTTDDNNFRGGTANSNQSSTDVVFNRNLKMTISIDDEPYQIQLTGKEDVYKKVMFWNIKAYTLYYSFGDFLNALMSAVENSSNGYGDYFISNINLSKFFTIYKYKDGKVVTDNVTDIIDNYTVIKVHYSEYGATKARESLFGMIEANRNYGSLDEDIDTDYWKGFVKYRLTEFDMNYRHSEYYSGELIYLDIKTIETLNGFKDKKITIILDLDNIDKKIIGLDMKAFENLEIETLTITSTKTQDFIFLTDSLKNTNLKNLNYSASLNLIFNSAIDTEFKESTL